MKQRYNPLQDPVQPDQPIQHTTALPLPPASCSPTRSVRKSKARKTKRPRAPREQVSQREALGRAMAGISLANYPAIIQGFIARGIPADDIKPRENVFTFNAWRALGRTVRRGEKAVKVLTWITRGGKETLDPATGELVVTDGKRIPWTAFVFHISQTDRINPLSATSPIQKVEALSPLSTEINSAVSPGKFINWRTRIQDKT